jgi:uncharacterized protein involved in exopolysaccharide biosynthesis
MNRTDPFPVQPLLTAKSKFVLGLALLLGGMALCGSGLWLLLTPPQYAAAVRIKLEQIPEAPAPGGFSSDPYFIQADFEIMQSDIVLSNVVAALRLNEVWGEKRYSKMPLKYAECYAIIRNHMRLAPVPPTLNTRPRLIDIIYCSSDPKEAAEMANAIAEGYKQYRDQSRKELLASGLQSLQQLYKDQEKQISLQPTNSEQVLSLHKCLATRIEAVKLDMAIPNTSMVQIIGQAKPPQFPASTNRPLGAALLAVGLFPLLGGILLLKSKP